MENYIYAFLGVGVVSLVSLVGVFTLSLKEEIIRKYIFIFISLAVGALLGDAFIHLIPKALENSEDGALTGILIVLGILIFLILEKFLHWHHHGEDMDEPHVHPVGKLILFSDAVHNFIDGIIIGVSFMVNIPVGVATTLAVILHEIPQEVGDFAVLLHSGYTRSRALFLNFLSAVVAFLGLILVVFLSKTAELVNIWFLPIAAGGFIYIAIADLLPELQKTKKVEHNVLQIFVVILGVAVMFALTWLE